VDREDLAAAGRLSAKGHACAREEFDSVHDELLVVGIGALPAREAGRLAEELALRGYDAVHLASALALGTRQSS
jgi:predicted nucleic acid-binding protein